MYVHHSSISPFFHLSFLLAVPILPSIHASFSSSFCLWPIHLHINHFIFLPILLYIFHPPSQLCYILWGIKQGLGTRGQRSRPLVRETRSHSLMLEPTPTRLLSFFKAAVFPRPTNMKILVTCRWSDSPFRVSLFGHTQAPSPNKLSILCMRIRKKQKALISQAQLKT